MNNEFSKLQLHEQLVQAVASLGYTEPTLIQTQVIPLFLAGHDVIGQAQTGTGKTAAFALPLLHKLAQQRSAEGAEKRDPRSKRPVQSLILAPTRELALQVAQAITDYSRYLDVAVLAVYGGQAYDRQIRQLKQGVDVVVGTPGRLLDLMARKVLDLSTVQNVVLDEADEMLSMGFIDDIEAILEATPTARQTALFSATLPQEIRRLAVRYLRDPQSIKVQNKQLTVAAIEQRYYLVNESDKLAALTRLFEVEEITRGLIFVRTRVSAGELANELTVRGFPAEAIHGDLSQDAREGVLNRFRQDQLKVLVATDVAARGLDIDDISHVFNFDLPLDPEVYVHRVGRTGRAGKTGVAVSLINPKEEWRLRKIEAYTKQKVTPFTLPTVEEILSRREAQLIGQMEVWLRRGRYQRERELVTALVEAGHEPWEVAAAALKVARGEEKQRPIAPISEVQPLREPRSGRDNQRATHRGDRDGRDGRPSRDRQAGHNSHEAGMVRLSLNAGKAHGVRPNDVVGTIAYHANIPGKTIGAIRIQEQHTLVDVPQEFVQQVLAKTNNYRIRQHVVTVERA